MLPFSSNRASASFAGSRLQYLISGTVEVDDDKFPDGGFILANQYALHVSHSSSPDPSAYQDRKHILYLLNVEIIRLVIRDTHLINDVSRRGQCFEFRLIE